MEKLKKRRKSIYIFIRGDKYEEDWKNGKRRKREIYL